MAVEGKRSHVHVVHPIPRVLCPQMWMSVRATPTHARRGSTV